MNTKILLRTIDEIDNLQYELKNKGFDFSIDEERLQVLVGYSSLQNFREIVKKYLNAPYNYINVKFPERKTNFLIFLNKDFLINNQSSDKAAKAWALSIGLSQPETEWTTFY